MLSKKIQEGTVSWTKDELGFMTALEARTKESGKARASSELGLRVPAGFFGKHIYRLNSPLTAVDPVDPQIPSRPNPPGSVSLWFYAVHRAYS